MHSLQIKIEMKLRYNMLGVPTTEIMMMMQKKSASLKIGRSV